MTAHAVKITNPTGDGVLTRVEVDGVQQFVSSASFTVGVESKDTIVRLVYPWVAAEITLDKAEVERQYSARLFIPGYEGVREQGYGKTIADALRDLAGRVER